MSISVWNICKMALTGEGQTNRKKICLCDKSYTTDPTVLAEDWALDLRVVKASEQLPYQRHGLIFVWAK